MEQRIFLLKIILIFCFFLALIYFFITPVMPDPQYRWTMLILTIIGTITYFFTRKIEFGTMHWLSVAPVFILGYLIVFYQMALLDLLGYSVSRIYHNFVWASETVVNKSIGVATLGILAFYLGALSFGKANPSQKKYDKNNKFSTKSITLLLVLAYIFYVLFFLSAGSYSSGVYASQDASGTAVYLYKVFEASLIAAIILKLSSITSLKNQRLSFKKYIFNFGKPLLVLLGWHLLFSLYVGDRGPLITYTLLTLGLYFIRWKKLNFIYLIVGLFVVSTFMTIIGDVRQAGGSSSSELVEKISKASNSMENNKITKRFDMHVPGSSTIELALSVNTLNYALFNVPDKYDYQYGLFQLQYIYGIVPGLAGRISALLYGTDTKYYSSSKFVTYLIQGNRPTYGNGTSVVADFYLDFGVIGVIVGLFLFGIFVRKNESRLFFGYQYPTFIWIATLIFFSKALYLNRSSIGQELAAIAMIYILIRINAFLVPKFRKKKVGVK